MRYQAITVHFQDCGTSRENTSVGTYANSSIERMRRGRDLDGCPTRLPGDFTSQEAQCE